LFCDTGRGKLGGGQKRWEKDITVVREGVKNDGKSKKKEKTKNKKVKLLRRPRKERGSWGEGEGKGRKGGGQKKCRNWRSN